MFSGLLLSVDVFSRDGWIIAESIIDYVRLRGASEENVFWFFVVFFGCLALAGLVMVWEAYALRRRKQEVEELSQQGMIEAAGLNETEEEVLENIADYADEPVVRSLKLVEVFDKGADRAIAVAEEKSSLERLEFLRNLRSLRKKLNFDQANPQQPMKSTRSLPVDLDVILVLKSDDGQEEFFPSVVFHNAEESILLRLNAEEQPGGGERFWGTCGVVVRAHFFRANEGSYSFESAVVDYRRRGPGFVRVKHPKKLRRQQRRNFLRIDMEETVRFRWFSEKDATKGRLDAEDLERRVSEQEGTVHNLSGDGLQLAADEVRFEADDWVELTFPFLPTPLDTMACFARVVHVYEPWPEGVYGLEFERPAVRLQLGILKEVERRHAALRAPDEKERLSNPMIDQLTRRSLHRPRILTSPLPREPEKKKEL
ncbi:MAG: PilZ domain-containing protein [Planctomycetes bacterium]|nr:PilZ domain-containing protein [Planctomycetota bacterium]